MANMDISKIDIGRAISIELEKQNMTKTEFARKFGIAQSNVNRILEKESIDTDKLVDISNILGFNFFTLFCQDETPKIQINHPDVTDHSAFSANGDVLVDDHRGGLDFSTKTKGDESGLVKSLQDHIATLKSHLADKERIIRLYEARE